MVCFGLYKYEIVKVTEKFKSVVLAATLAIATYYLFSWLLSMFTSFQPVHYGNSMFSIGISAFVIVIAALNLFLDFDQIEKGVQQKMPKYMERSRHFLEEEDMFLKIQKENLSIMV